MVILALETTTDICSVALGSPDSFLEASREIPRQHNQYLLEMIDEVCDNSPHAKASIDCVAFSAGPGSFTGVRMGSAVTQALAAAFECKALGLPSALVLAHIAHNHTVLEGKFRVLRRSRRDLMYEAEVTYGGSGAFTLLDERLVSESAITLDEVILRDGNWNVCAAAVLALAAAVPGEWHEPHLALPRYIEGDTPWRKITQNASK